jgi:accessory colonization factor AcfC
LRIYPQPICAGSPSAKVGGPTDGPGGENHLHVFATGSTTGPLRRAAQAFVLLSEGTTFDLTVAGSRKLYERMIQWKEGDLVCGGSESVMDAAVMFGCVLQPTLRPLGVREASILVPNGNPADIRSLEDMTRPDVRVGVCIQGSLEGVWEGVALRAGLFEGIRKRVTAVAEGSSDLMAILAKREVDAAIGWSTAALLGPERIETLEIRPEWRCHRVTGIGITPWCEALDLAREFVDFLVGPEGQEIWFKFGWKPIKAARVDPDWVPIHHQPRKR